MLSIPIFFRPFFSALYFWSVKINNKGFIFKYFIMDLSTVISLWSHCLHNDFFMHFNENYFAHHVVKNAHTKKLFVWEFWCWPAFNGVVFFREKNFFFLPKTLIGIDLKMCEVRKVNHSLAQAIRIILVIKASSNERLFAFTMIYSMDCWLLECVSSKNYEEVAKSTF